MQIYQPYPPGMPIVVPYQAPVITPGMRRLATITGLRAALGIGMLGFCQVVISTTTVLAHAGAVLILQHQASALQNLPNQSYTGGVPQPELLILPTGISILSCWLLGLLALVIVYITTRDAAIATGITNLGRRAGIVAILLGAFLWIVCAAIGALLTGSDGSFVVADPLNSTPILAQHITAMIIALVRGLLLGAFSILFALIPIGLGVVASHGKGAR
jgi:hypothetical protein